MLALGLLLLQSRIRTARTSRRSVPSGSGRERAPGVQALRAICDRPNRP